MEPNAATCPAGDACKSPFCEVHAGEAAPPVPKDEPTKPSALSVRVDPARDPAPGVRSPFYCEPGKPDRAIAFKDEIEELRAIVLALEDRLDAQKAIIDSLERSLEVLAGGEAMLERMEAIAKEFLGALPPEPAAPAAPTPAPTPPTIDELTLEEPGT